MSSTGQSATHYSEAAYLNWLRGTTMPAAPAAIYAALFTVAGGEGTGGTECSYSGYARQAVAFAAPVTATTGSTISNSGTVTFPTNTASMTIVELRYFDALTVGNCVEYVPGLSIAVAASQPLYFIAGDLVIGQD